MGTDDENKSADRISRDTVGSVAPMAQGPLGESDAILREERTRGYRDGVRLWIRFCTPSVDDPRPVVHPRPFDWWQTGSTDDEAIICGVVDAQTELEALQIVLIGWPEVTELDFCEPRGPAWEPPADRFPPYEKPLSREKSIG